MLMTGARKCLNQNTAPKALDAQRYSQSLQDFFAARTRKIVDREGLLVAAGLLDQSQGGAVQDNRKFTNSVVKPPDQRALMSSELNTSVALCHNQALAKLRNN